MINIARYHFDMIALDMFFGRAGRGAGPSHAPRCRACAPKKNQGIPSPSGLKCLEYPPFIENPIEENTCAYSII